MEKNPFSEFEEEFIPDFSINGEKNKDKVTIRVDPIFGDYSLHTTSISEARAKKPETPKKYTNSIDDITNCFACHLERTPDEKLFHLGLYTEKDENVISLNGKTIEEVVSTPNKYPFAVDHKITIFTTHKPDLKDLTFNDIVNYFESTYQLALIFRENSYGMANGMNWGEEAAASLNHPHSQSFSLPKIAKIITNQESEAIGRRAADLGEDPFEWYMDRLRNSPYFIFENEFIFIYAPFAPQFSDQVDVITKKVDGKIFRNILDITSDNVRRTMSSSLTGIFHALRDKRYVTDLNVETHQGMFNQKGFYRLHWHILPRNKGKIGFSENINFYPIIVPPEITGKELYDHYHPI